MTIPSTIIPYINYIIFAYLIIQVILGYRKGFLYQVFSLLAILTAILISWYFSPTLAGKFKIYPEGFSPFSGTDLGSIFYDKINSLTWFVILFAAVLLIFLLVKPLAKSLMDLPILNAINHTLGAVFSLLPAAVVLALVAYFFGTPLITNGRAVLDNSLLGPIYNISTNSISLLKQPYLTEEAIQKLVNSQQDLTDEDVQLLWDWLLKENADPKTIEDFLTEHTNNVNVQSDEQDPSNS